MLVLRPNQNIWLKLESGDVVVSQEEGIGQNEQELGFIVTVTVTVTVKNAG